MSGETRVVPAAMFHHEFYPWTYLLPDGRLFIAGPHVPTQRFDWTAPAGFASFAPHAGDRSSGGGKGASVMAIRKKVQGDYRPNFPDSETPTPAPLQGK